MSTVQQRKNEILAKRAKLAELKKQRELRQKEFTTNRNSVGDASEVRPQITRIYLEANELENSLPLQPPPLALLTAELSSMI